MAYEYHTLATFLGETSPSWDKPLPEDKTIHVEVFQNPNTGEIEYFRHDVPFHMQLHVSPVHPAEGED
tara:strand:- start:443 stop:646 length:204 start_codon:yes stop_codon:yes gene_type:complete